MKLLDRYIIKNFLGTFSFATVFLLSISVVIDFSSRMHRLEAHGGSAKEALLSYYPIWALWLGNTFMPIIVFISVIFFTSKLSNNSEIIAISSSGVNTNRLLFPYLISAFIIGFISLILNHYILPITNKQKNEFLYKYLISVMDKDNQEKDKKVSIQLSKDEYLFIENFSKSEKYGRKVIYQKFKDQTLIHLLTAESLSWDETKKEYVLYNYNERKLENGKELYKKDFKLTKKFPLTPDELIPEEYSAEIINTPKLKEFIKKEKEKGGSNLNNYLNEYYQRTSLPFSTFILTLLGFSLSSEKRRGGTGINLALGISLAFFYLFFMELSKNFSANNQLPSFLAVWLPNIIFGGISAFFYWKRIQK